jgi:hypothetical protein
VANGFAMYVAAVVKLNQLARALRVRRSLNQGENLKRIKFARILATEALDDLICGKFLRERRRHYGIGEAPSDDAAAFAAPRQVTALWCDTVTGVEVVHGVELIA